MDECNESGRAVISEPYMGVLPHIRTYTKEGVAYVNITTTPWLPPHRTFRLALDGLSDAHISRYCVILRMIAFTPQTRPVGTPELFRVLEQRCRLGKQFNIGGIEPTYEMYTLYLDSDQFDGCAPPVDFWVDVLLDDCASEEDVTNLRKIAATHAIRTLRQERASAPRDAISSAWELREWVENVQAEYDSWVVDITDAYDSDMWNVDEFVTQMTPDDDVLSGGW